MIKIGKDRIEEKYCGIPRNQIPELNAKYMEGLTKTQKQDVVKRWRLVKDFEDGNAVGKILLDNVSVATFNDFRSISREYFGNSDGPCLAGLVQLFKLHKHMQGIGKEGDKVGN